MALVEFQPIIMAAGRGSRMADITNKIPKALLPIGNLPMIWYPIQMLEKYGFEEAMVIVLKSSRSTIENALRGLFKDGLIKMKRFDYISIPDEEDWGTADSLRVLKDKVKTDMLVVSCDLVADVPLNRVADLHRVHSSTITALFSTYPTSIVDQPAPGSKTKKKAELDFIGLEDKGDRLLFLSSDADFEDNVTFKKSLLRRHPCISVYSRLTDAHLYLIKHSVLDLLVGDLNNVTSLKGELIPYLVNLQSHQKKSTAPGPSSDNLHVLESGEKNDLLELAQELSSWNDHRGDMDDCYHGNSTRCYAHVMDEGCFCVRVNTISTYCEVNRQIPKHISTLCPNVEMPFVHASVTVPSKAQVGPESMLGESTRLGDKLSIKKSVIGPHCHISEKVKITNSIIMDHVTIGEGCNIQNSIICQNAHIGDRCDLKDTIVGSEQKINSMSKCTNEVIMDLECMMEI